MFFALKHSANISKHKYQSLILTHLHQMKPLLMLLITPAEPIKMATVKEAAEEPIGEILTWKFVVLTNIFTLKRSAFISWYCQWLYCESAGFNVTFTNNKSHDWEDVRRDVHLFTRRKTTGRKTSPGAFSLKLPKACGFLVLNFWFLKIKEN